MKGVEIYAQVRFAVQIKGLSRREAARQFGIDPRTVAKMLAFSVPPGYRRSRPPARPKLDPFTGIIEAILAEDERRPKKQRHTSKRIFERLRDEHGYSGGITIVEDYVLSRRLGSAADANSGGARISVSHISEGLQIARAPPARAQEPHRRALTGVSGGKPRLSGPDDTTICDVTGHAAVTLTTGICRFYPAGPVR